MIRAFFLLLLIGGIGVGIVYPWSIANWSGEELGRFQVYDRASGFVPVTVRLTPDDGPVRVLVEMASLGGAPSLTGSRTVLTLTATANGKAELSSTLTFSHQEPRNDSPQSGGMIYGDVAGTIATPLNADYRFVLGQGEVADIAMRSVTIALRSGVADMDGRLIPIGYVLMAVGFIGFVLALRRRKRQPVAEPSRKWGRQ